MSKPIICVSELAKNIYNLCNGKGVAVERYGDTSEWYTRTAYFDTGHTSIAASFVREPGKNTWVTTVLDHNLRVRSYEWSE